MRYGLKYNGGSIAMIPSYVTRRPNGKEIGIYWAIDFGGTNIRIAKFELIGNGVMEKRDEIKAE